MPQYTYSSGFTTDFEHIQADSSHNPKFSVLYTHGFCADPWGRKPEEIKNWCLKHNINFYRYELAGHGSDSKNLEKADFNIWKNQILEIIDDVIQGPILVAGASLGGWLSLVAAVKRPERICGLLGLAAAPDFTKDNEQFITKEQQLEMEQTGKIVFDNNGFQTVVTKQLVETGNQNLLLDKPHIPIFCPVVLIQGMEDDSVYWPKALKIAEKIQSREVMVKLLKNSNHRLNENKDINEILSALDTFL